MHAASDFDPEVVEREYNNRAAVPEHPRWLAEWAERSAAARAGTRVHLDLRYGPGPKETLDLFLPRAAARGVLVFLHGGYWRALDKADHAFVAPALVAADVAVAVVNYDLCPDVTIATIVEESRRALAWVASEAAHYDIDASRLVVAGHSAGGHLAAMLHATPWSACGLRDPQIRGSVSISGVHDLAPMVHFSHNADLRLDRAEAYRLSPVHLAPTTSAPIVVAIGAQETSGFLRQAELLCDAWPAHAGRPMLLPERHHFSVVVDLADPDSALARATLDLFG